MQAAIAACHARATRHEDTDWARIAALYDALAATAARARTSSQPPAVAALQQAAELDAAAGQIRVTYVDGPFKHLENRWTFQQRADGGTDVKFFIDYEFRSRTFQMIVGAVFDKVFRKMAEAFEARADELARRK